LLFKYLFIEVSFISWLKKDKTLDNTKMNTFTHIYRTITSEHRTRKICESGALQLPTSCTSQCHFLQRRN